MGDGELARNCLTRGRTVDLKGTGTMTTKKYPPTRDRRDIGRVVFPIEKMAAARELSSCCVGVEAALETDTGLSGVMRQLRDDRDKSGS